MTLVEMTLVVSLVSIVLFLLVGWTDGLREDARRDLAMRMLADLDKALARYHRDTGSYPVSRGPNSSIQATLDLYDHERTRPILDAFPDSLWQEGRGRFLVDPWGTRLRYFGPDSDSPYVGAHGGRPIFICAGPDRDFGDSNPAALGDNLRSDDPGPEGFRLHDRMRDMVTDEEQSIGDTQKDN